jgi:predicted unusual protein kinase regulating ubiquinone biosynthesis (AarF/ABC1/UbiB family)
MLFDNFVNKILKENLIKAPSRNITNIPKNNQNHESNNVKKISDIGNYQTPPQKNINQKSISSLSQIPTQDKNEEDQASPVEDLVKQMANSQQKEDMNAKKLHDDFAKLIATLTNVQKSQNQQQNTPNNQTADLTNPQDIISTLKKNSNLT